MRRSGRKHFKPLKWWAGEHFEYARGQHQPEIKEVVRKPQEYVPARSNRGRRPGRARSGRSESVAARSGRRARSESVVEDEDEEIDLDEASNPIGHVNQFANNVDVKRRVMWTKKMLEPKAVRDANFLYQKVFGEDKFLASGVVILPLDGSKPAKQSKDNAYVSDASLVLADDAQVFYVMQGVVRVTVHKTTFVAATGAQFLIPRGEFARQQQWLTCTGNLYEIQNISKNKQAELFFAQARKIMATDEEEEALEDIEAQEDASQLPIVAEEEE